MGHDPLPVGLIGFGAIGQQVALGITRAAAGDERLVGVLVRRALDRDVDAPVFTDLGKFLAAGPRVVVEAAGPSAFATHAEAIIASGASLVSVSASALLDAELTLRLETLCRRHSVRLYFPPGALGGLDALAAAAVGGLDDVRLRVVQPDVRLTFRGDAIGGARRCPADLNVAVMAALVANRDVHVEVLHQEAGREMKQAVG